MNPFNENMSAHALIFLAIGCASAAIYDDLIVPMGTYQLPRLPYSYTALEPFIDSATLAVHHQGHHKSYTDKLNAALAEWRTQVQLISQRTYLSRPFTPRTHKSSSSCRRSNNGHSNNVQLHSELLLLRLGLCVKQSTKMYCTVTCFSCVPAPL